VSLPPQPSLISPQLTPFSAQLVGTQLVHSLLMHDSPAGQVPQLPAAPEHAFAMLPQFLPCAVHSAGGAVGRQWPLTQL
jgi:hypothetical protein